MANAASSDTCPISPDFDFGVRIGLVLIVQAACLSALAVIGLLAYIIYSTVKIKRGAARHWSTATHVHWYFMSLMVSDLIQAIGGIMNVRWIADAKVTEGHLCTAQGALKQLGDVGVALATLAIAIHTFCVIVFKWRPSSTPLVAIAVLCGIWLFLVLIVGISLGTHKGQDYYGNTQYWCWITSSYPAQRIALEYFWMWFTCLLNIVIYIPIALVLKGYLVVNGSRVRWLKGEERIRVTGVSARHNTSDTFAIKMLFYPAIYTFTVLPIAIVRWDAFYGRCIPWAATVFADVIFASSGTLNVLLFTITRPNLLPHRDNSSRSLQLSPPSANSFRNNIPRAGPYSIATIHDSEPRSSGSPVITPTTIMDDTSKIHVLMPTPSASLYNSSSISDSK